MGLEDRVRRLEKRSPYTRLRCAECEQRFVLYGDGAAQYLSHWWKQHLDGKSTAPECIRSLYEHPHDPGRLINSDTGRPWLESELPSWSGEGDADES